LGDSFAPLFFWLLFFCLSFAPRGPSQVSYLVGLCGLVVGLWLYIAADTIREKKTNF